MFAQITKGLSESIDKALAKHASQNLSHQNLTKPAQNLASQSLAPQVQTQANTRQALTRFGNELAQNPQTKPTQAVFDFDFIARDKTPELPNQTAQNLPQNNKNEVLQNLQHLPNAPQEATHTTQAQNLAPHTPQSQSLQARYETLRDFASKASQAQRELPHEAKSLYDSFAKSLDSLSPESLSAKELNATDRHLSEYLVRTELAQVSNAKDIVLPYFSAKYQAKNEAELAQTFGSDKLAQMRQALQESKNTNPLAEFGTNYAEFYQDGKGAIAKLIAEANAAKEAGKDFSGQVAGAFSKEIDGAEASIDLVWGKITNAQTHEGYGLAHIIDKHPELDLSLIPQIIENGKIVENAGTKTIIYKTDSSELRVGLSKGFLGKGDNEWIITAYEKATPAQNFDQVASKVQSGNNLSTSGDNEIIQKISQKFNKDENFAKNLYEWHKYSHPITKEADGTPKVFYHGSKAYFEIFERQNKAELGYFFTDIKSYANIYKNKNGKLYKAFLHIKKPMDLRDKKLAQKYSNEIFGNDLAQLEQRLKQNLNGLKPTLHDLKGEWMRLRMDKYKKLDTNYIFAKKAEELGFDGIIDFNGALVVFDSNQIKAVGNKGTFEATNPNIYHSSSTAGGGVLGGAIAGVERDEEGNIIGFSPEKFALGFASGAVGAKALRKIANTKTITLSQKSIQKLATNPRAKAILEKIHIKSDIIPALEKGEQVKEADIIKALESSPQKGQEMLIIGKQNLSEGVLEWAKNNNKKIAVDILPEQKAKELGFRYPKVKRTISASEINHTLRRHANKNEEKPLTIKDIGKWIQYADEADKSFIAKDKLGQEVLVSGKQINGYYVVVESVRKKTNELAFKTMYFSKGDLSKNKSFQTANGKTAPSHQVTSPPLN